MLSRMHYLFTYIALRLLGSYHFPILMLIQSLWAFLVRAIHLLAPCSFPTMLLSKTTLRSWMSLSLSGKKKTRKKNQHQKNPCLFRSPLSLYKETKWGFPKSREVNAKMVLPSGHHTVCIKIKDMKRIVKRQRGNYTEKQINPWQPEILVYIIKLNRLL